MQVECSGGELLSRGHHVLDGPPQTVVNVHHGQPRVRPQVALVLLAGQSVVEDLDSVVGGSSSRVGVVGNYPGEPEELRINSAFKRKYSPCWPTSNI